MLPERTYPFLFFAIVLVYCLLYAPYGINETDGGFLSGLGWQVLSGKTIYQDIVCAPTLAGLVAGAGNTTVAGSLERVGRTLYFLF